MRERGLKICLYFFSCIILGILYGFYVMKTGNGIPCFFRTLTGLYCPGCGISHLLIALMKGDVQAAFYSNPALFVCLPFILLMLFRYIIRYVQTGSWSLNRFEQWCLYLIIFVLVGYCMMRNQQY